MASVCLFVCPHDNFQMTKRRTMKLCIVQKSHPSFKVKVTRDKKKQKSAESSPLTVHSTTCAVGCMQQAATGDTIVWPPRGDGLCRWENQHLLSSSAIRLYLSDEIYSWDFLGEVRDFIPQVLRFGSWDLV